jgi:acetyltransferase-like isoleucine patch superfamily enzyme
MSLAKKQKINGKKLFKCSKVILLIIIKSFLILPRFLRIFLWDIISPYSQLIFVGIRYIILKSMIKKCGDNVFIGKNVSIQGWENLEIGNNVSLNANCYIDATVDINIAIDDIIGCITIGDNVGIGHNTSILSREHTWGEYELPIVYNKEKFRSIIIQNDVWIGCGCRILAGTKIQERVVIGAGAVVKNVCKSNYIYAGVPCKPIKNLSDS